MELVRILRKASRIRLINSPIIVLNRLLLRLGPWRFRLEGQTLYAATLDRIVVILLHRLALHDHDFEIDLWRRLCTRGAHVVDVGANLGLLAFVAAERVGPEGKVWAFEADPINTGMIRRGLAANGYANVNVIAAAVSDHVGTVRLKVREEHRGDIRIAPEPSERDIEVPTTTLDAALSDSPPIDVIKFDIQGAEQLAFNGMARVLAHSPRIRVITEFGPKSLRDYGCDPKQFLSFWRERDFRAHIIDEHRAAVVALPEEQILAIAEDREFINLYFEPC